MPSKRADFSAGVLERLRDALGVPLDGATVSVVCGEARVDLDGRCAARVVPLGDGGWHVELAPELGDAMACAAASRALGERLPFDTETWALVVGRTPWRAPFDRGPGIYRVADVDAGGVSRRLFAGVDVRIVYLEASCAADCVFCGHTESTSDGVPEAMMLARLRAGTLDVGGAHLVLGGPEPLAHPQVDEIAAALSRAGASRVEVITSGSSLPEAGRAARLRASSVSAVSIPLYGAVASTHDAVVRRDGAFDAALAALRAARESGMVVHVHSLVLAQNALELERLARLCADEGASLVLGMPRAKFEWAHHPSARDVTRAARAAQLLGVPRCVVPPSADDDGRALLARYGPMVVYLAVQAGTWGDACASCTSKPRCWGAPTGMLEYWEPSLVPTGAPAPEHA